MCLLGWKRSCLERALFACVFLEHKPQSSIIGCIWSASCHEPQNDEAWVCICGNTPSGDGFFPCNEKGDEVEPTEKDWTTNWYVCFKCGRMIDQDTLEVVGRNEHFKLLA